MIDVSGQQTMYVKPTGAVGGGGPEGPMRSIASRMDFAQAKFDAGELDAAAFQEKVVNRWGDAVNEAFGEDGSIDFAKLEEIVQPLADALKASHIEQRVARAETGVEMGVIDPVEFQSRLEGKYGAGIADAFGEDGSIDFAMLYDLIMAHFEEAGTEEAPDTAGEVLDSSA